MAESEWGGGWVWAAAIFIVIFIIAWLEKPIENIRSNPWVAQCALKNTVSWNKLKVACEWKWESRQCYDFIQSDLWRGMSDCLEGSKDTKVWKCISKLKSYNDIIKSENGKGMTWLSELGVEKFSNDLDELTESIKNCVILNK